MKEMCKNTTRNKLCSHLNVVSLSIQIANVLFQKSLSVQSFLSIFAQKLSKDKSKYLRIHKDRFEAKILLKAGSISNCLRLKLSS